MSDLNGLREEYRRKRANAGSKISRIKSNTGAEIAGSNYDPRRSPGVEKRYNRAQLNAAIRQLDNFNSRSVQFIGVGNNLSTPVKRTTWNVYKRREAENNRLADQHDASMANLQRPGRDSNLGQIRAQRSQSTQGSSVYGPYQRFNRSPRNFESERGLEVMSNNMLSKLTEKFFNKKINQGRENIKTVLELMGESAQAELIDNLSDYQFDVLWHGDPDTIDRLFMRYDVEQAKAKGENPKRWQEEASNGAIDEFVELFEWVESDVPTTAQTQSRPTRSSKKTRARGR